MTETNATFTVADTDLRTDFIRRCSPRGKVHGWTVGKRVSVCRLPRQHLIWYLTYRGDRNAAGGFACPKTVAALLECGVDPLRRNHLGLCWNDVRRHVVRPEE